MDYETLVRRLGFCSGAEQTLLQTAAPAGPQAVQALCGAAAEEAEQALRAALAPDEDGMKMLACMLRAALHTRALYREKGIPEDIFGRRRGFCPASSTRTPRYTARPPLRGDGGFGGSSPCGSSASAPSNTR